MRKAVLSIMMLCFGTLFSSGLAFLTQVIIARNLGPEQYGDFSSALTLVSLLVPLAGFGVSQWWLKQFGKEGNFAQRFIPVSMRFACFTTVLATMFVVIWALVGPHSNTYRNILYIISLYIAGQSVVELVSSRLQLEEAYFKLTFWQALPHFSRLALVFLYFYLFAGTVEASTVAMAFSAVALVLIVSSFYPLCQLYLGKVSFHKYEIVNILDHTSKKVGMREVFLDVYPFGLAGIFHLLYFQSDIVLIKYLIGSEAAGIYNVAFMIITVVMILPSIIYQRYLLPKMHRWANHDQKAFNKVYKSGNYLMLGLGVFIMIIVLFSSPFFVPLIFGSSYEQSVLLISVLSFSIPVLFLASSVGATLVTQENMKIKVKVMGSVAIINVILNIVFLPLYGVVSAAVVTTFCNCVLLFSYFCVRFYSKTFPKKDTINEV